MDKKFELLNIDELIVNMPSFKKIMEDEVVTDEELQEQTDLVVNLLKEADKRFSADDMEFIKKLFAETNVLTAVYHYHELQKLLENGNIQ